MAPPRADYSHCGSSEPVTQVQVEPQTSMELRREDRCELGPGSKTPVLGKRIFSVLGSGVKGFCQSVLDGVGLLIDELAADPMFASQVRDWLSPSDAWTPRSFGSWVIPLTSVISWKFNNSPSDLGLRWEQEETKGTKNLGKTSLGLRDLSKQRRSFPEPGELSDNRFVSARFTR